MSDSPHTLEMTFEEDEYQFALTELAPWAVTNRSLVFHGGEWDGVRSPLPSDDPSTYQVGHELELSGDRYRLDEVTDTEVVYRLLPDHRPGS